MQILGLLTAVAMIGGPTPTFKVTPMGFHDIDVCRERAAEYNRIMPPTGFTKEGEVIVYKEYSCVIFMPEDLKVAGQ